MKKKILFIVLSCIIASLTIGSFVILFITGGKLPTPGDLKVYSSDGNKFLEIVANDEAYGYLFVIKSENGVEFTLESTVNILDISDYVENNLKFYFKVAYKAGVEGANSNYSQVVEYIFKEELESAVISVNPLSRIVSWSTVENATHYDIYFWGGTGEPSVYTVTSSTNFATCSFDYSSVDIGNYSIYVRAKDETEGFIQSKISNIVNIDVKKNYDNAVFSEFNSETGIVYLISKYNVSEVNVFYLAKEYTFTSSGGLLIVEPLEDGSFLLKMDISGIYDSKITFFGWYLKSAGYYNNSAMTYINLPQNLA